LKKKETKKFLLFQNIQ